MLLHSMDKLIAVFAFKTTKGTYGFILDGTPEQHQEYIDRQDPKYPVMLYENKSGRFPELAGNPVHFSSYKKGDIAEIYMPADLTKRPCIASQEIDRISEEAELYGEPKRPGIDKYLKSLNKFRASLKDTADAGANEDLDAEF